MKFWIKQSIEKSLNFHVVIIFVPFVPESQPLSIAIENNDFNGGGDNTTWITEHSSHP